MNTEIEILRQDQEISHKAIITALKDDKVIVKNITLNKVQEWSLEDLKQCVKFFPKQSIGDVYNACFITCKVACNGGYYAI